MEAFMQISDPMISEHGRVYSLAGMKRLLKAVTKNGGVVSVRKSKGKKIWHSSCKLFIQKDNITRMSNTKVLIFPNCEDLTLAPHR